MSDGSSLGRPFRALVLILGGGNLASIGVHVLLVRGWGPVVHGQVAVLVAITSFIGVFASLGATNGYGTALLAQRSLGASDAKLLVRRVFGMTTIATLVLICLISPFAKDAGIVLLWSLMGAIVMCARMVLLSLGKEERLFFTHPLGDLLRLGLFSCLWALSMEADPRWVWSIVWVVVAGMSIGAARGPMAAYERVLGSETSPCPSEMEIFRQSLPFLGPWIAFNALPVIVPLLARLWGTLEETSVMQVLVVVALSPRLVAFPLKTLLLPRAAFLRHRRAFGHQDLITQAETAMFFVGVVGLGLAFWYLEPVLGWLFGLTYMEHGRAAFVLLAAGTMEAIAIQTDVRFESGPGKRWLWAGEGAKLLVLMVGLWLMEGLPVVDRISLSVCLAITVGTLTKLLPSDAPRRHRVWLGSAILLLGGACFATF